MERRELWRQWSIAKAKRKAIAVTPEQVGFIYHPLEELPRSTQTHRLHSRRPFRVKLHLTAEKPTAAGKAIPQLTLPRRLTTRPSKGEIKRVLDR
jgi:hypothetical protein